MRWLHRILALGLMALAVLFLGPSSGAYAAGESISGTLIVSQTGEPVEDVEITVTAADQAADEEDVEITVSSDADGRFTAELPGPGTYEVTLDTDTLPDGITLDGVSDTRKVSVTTGQRAAVLFPLSNGTEAVAQISLVWLQRLVEGLRYGLIIGITAVGVSLIFGTTGLTNFSHGEMVTVGAFVGWGVNTALGVPFALSILAAVLGGFAFGTLAELGLWRRLRRRGTGVIAMLVISIGLGIALRYLMLLIVGGDRHFYRVPPQVAVDVGGVSITPRDMLAMALALVVLLGVASMLQFTRMGKAMRAVSDNRELASASGINVDRVILMVWILSGGLAAFGGVIYGWTIGLRFDMGFTLLLLMFAGVTLGGLGSAYGALVGSLLIGVIVQMSTLVLPDDIKTVSGLLVLILVLLIRPSGLLGARTRIG